MKPRARDRTAARLSHEAQGSPPSEADWDHPLYMLTQASSAEDERRFEWRETRAARLNH